MRGERLVQIQCPTLDCSLPWRGGKYWFFPCPGVNFSCEGSGAHTHPPHPFLLRPVQGSCSWCGRREASSTHSTVVLRCCVSSLRLRRHKHRSGQVLAPVPCGCSSPPCSPCPFLLPLRCCRTAAAAAPSSSQLLFNPKVAAPTHEEGNLSLFPAPAAS